MKFKSFIFTLLALLIASCTLQPVPELDEPGKEEGKLVTINVTISPETRVTYDDANRTLAWEDGDQLLLAGYNASGDYMNQTSIFTYSGTGNIFTGQSIQGAATYKAYYPATVTLDANGIVQPLPDDFWQQTQEGDGSTEHLNNKLLLFDEMANPLNNLFQLELKSSIIRFDLTNVPQQVGELGEVIWTVETAAGVFKSMILNVTGVTFSPTVSSITAFLAFDPTVTGIAANGKVAITLCGIKSYQWSTILTGQKTYTAGNRYVGAVNGWTELDLSINPLGYFAEHNMADLNGTFETGHNTSGGLYLFKWNNAMTYNTTPATLGGKSYYLPTIQEWRAIIPESETYVKFSDIGTRTLNNAAVTVGGESYTMSGTFDNIGSVVYATLTYTLQSDQTKKLHAIARYWTENLWESNGNGRMVIKMKSTPVAYAIYQAKNADWNGVGVVSRVLPAAGYRDEYDNTPYYQDDGGFFWSSTEVSGYAASRVAYFMIHAHSASNPSKSCVYSVRLVSRE